uniref:Uncharacterized protein n=1 Tax=Anguilla anguilla TaxID=7936 RepID=A0A0E9PRV2_ANGAN
MQGIAFKGKTPFLCGCLKDKSINSCPTSPSCKL